MTPELDSLPDEVVQCILNFSHPQAAVSLGRTSRRFTGVANEPLLWQHYCLTTYQYWDSRHDIRRKFAVVDSTDWKELFAERHAIDRKTTDIVNAMIFDQTKRMEKIRVITTFGYDAKDILLRHMRMGEDVEDYLARRYWSNVVLGCLHRSLAILEWQTGPTSYSTGQDRLARTLGAFDMFVLDDRTGDMDEIIILLNTIAQRIDDSNVEPRLDELTPRQRAVTIAKYLVDNNLTGIAEGREYHNIEHNFLGVALSGNSHNCLPLVSVAIFCYVAQKLGLNAHVTNFPLHVHAIVNAANGFDLDGNTLEEGQRGQPMFLDPFRSTTEIPVDDLHAQLRFLGPQYQATDFYTAQSGTREIAIRCARNILNSPELTAQLPLNPIDMDSAQYAALWAQMVLIPTFQPTMASPARLRQCMLPLMALFAREFPNDVFLVERHVLPLFQGLPDYANLTNTIHSIIDADDLPPQVKKRSRLTSDQVKYRVGQVFQHRRYGYKAIITGWDATCEATEQWVEQMQVDRLKGGRNQSFYHSLVQDRSVRYVAEENVEIVTPENFEYPPSFPFEAGKYFKRWDYEARQFVSNMESEYPDD